MAMTCQRCQTELVPEANYCHHCGRRVEKTGGGTLFPSRSALRAMAVTPGVVAIIAWLLLFAEVKSVVITGPILTVCGIALLVASTPPRYGRGWILGLAHCGICLLFVLLVNAFNLSPRDAEVPFISLGFLFLVGCVPLTISTYRHAPARFDPSRCAKCGYMLYGLTEPRCPECGTAFDPAVLAGIPGEPM